jgi:mediator of RNA polymerase II transcription subunit 11
MSKDKPSQKQVDIHTNHFIKTLNHVELELGSHINYLTQVSTGQAHEGSSYAAQKTLQMAWHRSEHMRSKVIELERGKSQINSIFRQQQNRPGAGGPGPSSSTT